MLLRVLCLKTVEEVAETLMKIFVDFGPPKILQLDNDLAFLNKAMDKMKNRFGFKNQSTIPYFPQQNRVVKRFVGEAKRLVFKTINGDTSAWEKALLLTQRDMNNQILSRYGSRLFNVLFERRSNSLKNYRGTLATTMNTLVIEVRARDMGEIVFPAIGARAKRDAERKCKDKNKEEERDKRFRVGEWVMKKKNGLAEGVQVLWKGPYLIIGENEESKRYRLQDETKEEYLWEVLRTHLKTVRNVEATPDTYEIKMVLNHRGKTREREYLVKWVGAEELTWVNEKNILSKGVIAKYWVSTYWKKDDEWFDSSISNNWTWGGYGQLTMTCDGDDVWWWWRGKW
jgi:hypothetical protein